MGVKPSEQILSTSSRKYFAESLIWYSLLLPNASCTVLWLHNEDREVDTSLGGQRPRSHVEA